MLVNQISTELVSIDAIHKYIVEELLNDADIVIETEEDLLLSGFLDSMNVVRLVAHLEEKSTLTIPPEDITLENFGTLGHIHSYLNSDLQNRVQNQG